MKIAIVNNAARFLPFYINLAIYLEKKGIETIFVNPDKYLKSIYKRNKLTFEKYPGCDNKEEYYNELSNIIKFYKKIFQLRNIGKLIKLKNKEYWKAHQYFSNNKFDYVLILNGAQYVESDVCNDLGISTYFFEQGYFYQTIQMNKKGVNCNAEYANLNYKEILNFIFESKEFNPDINFDVLDIKESPVLRNVWRFFDTGFNSYLFKILQKKRKLKKATQRFRKLKKDNINLQEIGDYIFFPLQVNTDTQIVLNSHFSTMYDALEQILPVLKETGLKVLIKEHPMEVEPVDYKGFIDNKTVFLLKKYDINELIDGSIFVVNINSSVGFQALQRMKPVVLLGDAFYKKSPISIEFNKMDGTNLMEAVDNIYCDTAQMKSYMNHFRESIFIDGHFDNPTPELLEKIFNRLV